MNRKLYIGIDGGGTKTEGVLLDEAGIVLSRVQYGASSIIGSPSDGSLEVLKRTVDALCSENNLSVEEIAFCSLGLNGVDFDDEYDLQVKAISDHLGFAESEFFLVNDAVVALWGASTTSASVILQHGTGITSAYRSAYGAETLFDHLNVCKCYDIRSQTLTAVSRMIAGVLPADELEDAVLDLLEVCEADFPVSLFRRRLAADKLLRLPALVYSLWAEGNNYSRNIVESAIDDYVMLIQAMAKKTGAQRVAAILGGGVIEAAPEKFWLAVAEKLKTVMPDISLQKREFSPAVGAAILAAYKSGENISEYYKKVGISGKN